MAKSMLTESQRSQTKEIAATLFLQQNFTWLSISMGVSGWWLKFQFWVNFYIKLDL